MAIKSFDEFLELNIDPYISKKPSFKKNKKTGQLEPAEPLDYLSWADCLALLHRNGAERVEFGNVKSAADHPVFLLGTAVPFIRVYVSVDGDRRELDYPIIDGSKDISMEKLVQSDVHNATQRAFVKCVAVNWGLGLSLWQKEEKGELDEKAKVDLAEVSHIMAVKERVERMVTAKLKKGMDMTDICASLGIRETQFKKLMSCYDQLWLLESKLADL